MDGKEALAYMRSRKEDGRGDERSSIASTTSDYCSC